MEDHPVETKVHPMFGPTALGWRKLGKDEEGREQYVILYRMLFTDRLCYADDFSIFYGYDYSQNDPMAMVGLAGWMPDEGDPPEGYIKRKPELEEAE